MDDPLYGNKYKSNFCRMPLELVDQSYWDENYEKITFSIASIDKPIRKWIESSIQKSDGTCFEVGCFPGTYLAVFGELGYVLNGIDLTPGVERDLPDWLKNQGYKVGSFYREDFRKFKSDKKFDIVCSFGFMEHFTDWEKVLLMHAELVKENGILVIGVPNFRGIIQRLIHVTLNRENLRRHNMASMNPKKWERELLGRGFETIFCGYFGKFHFWVDSIERNLLQKLLLYSLTKITLTIKRYAKTSNAFYSPFCGIITRKKGKS